MSLAAETRRAASAHPFLVHALRAGVCNYTAAARFLDVDGDTDAVATALRRYADELPALETTDRRARVTMQSGVGPTEDGEAFLTVGDVGLGTDTGGDRTAILATGDLDAAALATILDGLAIEGVDVTAAGFADDHATVVVGRRDGANALRAVERALESVSN